MAAELAQEVRGGGPPLALLHGWGFDRRVFDGWADRLASRWRVIQIDLPGYGGSRHCRWDAEILPAQLAAVVPRAAIWIGWSLGAQLALRSAPAPAGFLLLGATPKFCRGGDWPWGVAPRQLTAMRRGLQRDQARVLGEFYRLLGVTGPAAEPPSVDALDGGLAWLAETDLRSSLRSVAAPTVWVVGDADPLVPVAAAAWAASACRRGRLAVVDGADHLPFLSHAEPVDAALEALRAEVEVH